MRLLYKRLADDASAPQRAHVGDAGWDVYSREHFQLEPGQRHTFSTGLAVQLSYARFARLVSRVVGLSWYIRVADRSGLANKHGITVLGGVVDSGYTGEVKIVLLNTGDTVWTVEVGDKIAQLVPTLIPAIDSAHEVTNLTFTDRGEKGFGSTN